MKSVVAIRWLNVQVDRSSMESQFHESSVSGPNFFLVSFKIILCFLSISITYLHITIPPMLLCKTEH